MMSLPPKCATVAAANAPKAPMHSGVSQLTGLPGLGAPPALQAHQSSRLLFVGHRWWPLQALLAFVIPPQQ